MTPAWDDPGRRVLELPRLQAGSSPQHLMVTLMADYWYASGGSAPSAALVELVGEFDVSASGARSALSRLAKRRLIEAGRNGRHTFYRLTDSARLSMRRGAAKVLGFAAGELPWDGRWTLVAFSVPEEARDTRPQLRLNLRLRGFAPLYDGVWVSPRGTTEDAWKVLADLGVSAATVFRAESIGSPTGGRDPLDAWDLTTVRGEYDAFLARFSRLREHFDRGELSSQAALNARTDLMDSWRRFPSMDPQLPDELLPAEWPRRRARGLFAYLYDALGPLAELRVRQVVRQHAPELLDQVQHMTTDTTPR